MKKKRVILIGIGGLLILAVIAKEVVEGKINLMDEISIYLTMEGAS